MPQSERIARWERMFDAVRANPIDAWCDRFLAALRGRMSESAGLGNSVLHPAAVA